MFYKIRALKLLQNWLENTFARTLFSIKLHTSILYVIKIEVLAKKRSCEVCKVFNNSYFSEHLWTAASENSFVEMLLQEKSLEVLVHLMVASTSAKDLRRLSFFRAFSQNASAWLLHLQAVTLLTEFLQSHFSRISATFHENLLLDWIYTFTYKDLKNTFERVRFSVKM